MRLMALAALLLCGCLGRTQLVEVERTRVVRPDGWEQLTAPVPEPVICQLNRIQLNEDLMFCRQQALLALHRCNAQITNLREQYEQIQKPDSTGAQ